MSKQTKSRKSVTKADKDDSFEEVEWEGSSVSESRLNPSTHSYS